LGRVWFSLFSPFYLLLFPISLFSLLVYALYYVPSCPALHYPSLFPSLSLSLSLSGFSGLARLSVSPSRASFVQPLSCALSLSLSCSETFSLYLLLLLLLRLSCTSTYARFPSAPPSYSLSIPPSFCTRTRRSPSLFSRKTARGSRDNSRSKFKRKSSNLSASRGERRRAWIARRPSPSPFLSSFLSSSLGRLHWFKMFRIGLQTVSPLLSKPSHLLSSSSSSSIFNASRRGPSFTTSSSSSHLHLFPPSLRHFHTSIPALKAPSSHPSHPSFLSSPSSPSFTSSGFHRPRPQPSPSSSPLLPPQRRFLSSEDRPPLPKGTKAEVVYRQRGSGVRFIVPKKKQEIPFNGSFRDLKEGYERLPWSYRPVRLISLSRSRMYIQSGEGFKADRLAFVCFFKDCDPVHRQLVLLPHPLRHQLPRYELR